MFKCIPPFIPAIQSALLIPLLCFALPAFGGMPLVAPAAHGPSAACATAPTETYRSGLNNKADPVFYSYSTDPIRTPTPQYCAFSATTGHAVESTSHTSGTLY